jgi:hypothetical protein
VAKPKSAATTTVAEENGNGSEEERTIAVVLDPADVDDLLQRFDVDSEDALGVAIRNCLLAGVAFPLESEELIRALQTFKCEDASELSDRVREQLLAKLPTSKAGGKRRE